MQEEITSGNITEMWTRLVNMVIRPPRAEYDIKSLGPASFTINNAVCQRHDFELKNERGLTIQCSHYSPMDPQNSSKFAKCPCVVYCHGNAGSRQVAGNIINLLLPYHISVFAFDFTGSGMSDGEYVSLGHYESQDLKVVVEHLRQLGTTTTIALWGRSMGAVSSLLYAATDPSIACMILDSPFADLRQLIEELVKRFSDKIPGFMISMAIGIARKSIQSRANFDVDDVSPVKMASSCFVPVVLAHAVNDELIDSKHATLISEAYAGDYQTKILTEPNQTHNSIRPGYFYHGCTIFLISCLNPSQLASANATPVSPVKPTANNNSFSNEDGVWDQPNFPEDNDQLGHADEDAELMAAIAASLKDMEESKKHDEHLQTVLKESSTHPNSPRNDEGDEPGMPQASDNKQGN